MRGWPMTTPRIRNRRPRRFTAIRTHQYKIILRIRHAAFLLGRNGADGMIVDVVDTDLAVLLRNHHIAGLTSVRCLTFCH